MPSLPPETSQPSTALMPWKPEYEMSIPCAYGPREATVQSRIIDLREADVDPVQLLAR